jgi:hypothetical protein
MVSAHRDDFQRQVEWKSVSRQKPCPICGKPDWCRTADNGRLITCNRSGTAAGSYRLLKLTSGGGAVFALEDGLSGVRTFQPRTIITRTVPAKPLPARPALWGELAAGWQQGAGDQLQLLSGQLGVSVESLRRLGCGWDQPKKCWTFPARDGDQQVIGIAQRLESPRLNRSGKMISKAMVTGSRQGLFYDPAAWSRGGGPILLVEGASDAAAAMTMGLAVVGRPSNRGGIDHLAQLLRDVSQDRPIVVVGERDQKPDGSWPGRDGAVSTATQLAKALHRAVLWAMPPDLAKDTREFLRTVQGLVPTAPHQIGLGLVAALLNDAEGITGAAAPIQEPAARHTGPARSLAEWRRDAAAAHRQAVAVPGLHLDRSPTGSGKTHATIEAIKRANSCLIALPTHANIREFVPVLQAAGIPAIPSPELSEANCENFAEASRARQAGLPVGRTACIGCPHKKGCVYRKETAAVGRAMFRVVTHQGLIRSPSLTKIRHRDGTRSDVAVVVIDENPVAVLQPTLAASPAGIASVADLAHRIMMRSLEKGDSSGAATFARQMADTAASIAETLGRIKEPGRYQVDLPESLEVPEHWEPVLWRAMQRHDAAADPGSEAMQLVTRAVTGQLDRLEVVVEKTPGGNLSYLAFASWRTRLAAGRISYQLLDATAQADDVAAAAGLPVNDITPAGHLPKAHPVIQIPLSITAATSAVTVAAIIRGLMERHPQFQRWGLIGFQSHISEIMGDGSDLLDAEARGRVAKHCYFWQGPDRASNDWHQVCDVVLVMGVPRPNPMAIRERLLMLGLDDAATMPDPVWGDIHWQADTTEGGTVTVPGRGYHHPEWRRAHRSICQAQLLQAMGRARSIIPEGVPCLVVADEPTGAAVDTRPIQTLPNAVQRVVDLIGRLGERQLSAIRDTSSEKLSFGPVRFQDLLKVYGGTRQALQKQLSQARRLGVVSQAGHGLWQLSRPADQPLVAAGPAEPVSVADVAADPVPAAVTATTTESASCDALDALRELAAERAAMLEFDGGMERDQADAVAVEMIMGSGLLAGRSGDIHQHLAAPDCSLQRRPPARPEPPQLPAVIITPMSQTGLWTPSQLRQMNPWDG